MILCQDKQRCIEEGVGQGGGGRKRVGEGIQREKERRREMKEEGGRGVGHDKKMLRLCHIF